LEVRSGNKEADLVLAFDVSHNDGLLLANPPRAGE
jgi:hypothetical protein